MGEALVSRGISLEVITDILTIVFLYVFISGCAGSSLLRAFSLVAAVVAHRLLTAVASLVSEHRL